MDFHQIEYLSNGILIRFPVCVFQFQNTLGLGYVIYQVRERIFIRSNFYQIEFLSTGISIKLKFHQIACIVFIDFETHQVQTVWFVTPGDAFLSNWISIKWNFYQIRFSSSGISIKQDFYQILCIIFSDFGIHWIFFIHYTFFSDRILSAAL